MSSFAASLLDELMGRNRNRNVDEEQKDLNWEDPEVCKFHLCGFCPHELFTNTRADLGSCYKIHDEELARNYKLSTRHGRMGYENDFIEYLETLISDVDRRIKRGQARLTLSAEHQAKQVEELTTAQETRLNDLTDKINGMIEETEKLGCEGQVDEAQEVMRQTEQLKEEKKILEEIKKRPIEPQIALNSLNSNGSKEMEVCTTCGAFLVVGDAIQRIEEHLQGKQHLGYMKIRDKIDDLKNGLKGIDSERESRLVREREEREREKAAERERERQRSTGERQRSSVEGRRKKSRSRSRDRTERRERSSKKRSRSRSSGKRSRNRANEPEVDRPRRRMGEDQHGRGSRDGRHH